MCKVLAENDIHTSVDEEQINAQVASLVLHMPVVRFSLEITKLITAGVLDLVKLT